MNKERCTATTDIALLVYHAVVAILAVLKPYGGSVSYVYGLWSRCMLLAGHTGPLACLFARRCLKGPPVGREFLVLLSHITLLGLAGLMACGGMVLAPSVHQALYAAEAGWKCYAFTVAYFGVARPLLHSQRVLTFAPLYSLELPLHMLYAIRNQVGFGSALARFGSSGLLGVIVAAVADGFSRRTFLGTTLHSKKVQ